MKVFHIHPVTPQERLLEQIVQMLLEGGLMAYPTDTCYGMGCSIRQKKSIDRVRQIRRLGEDKPLSFICSDLKNIADYGIVSTTAYKLMRRCLPGPYTFVLPATKLVPKLLQNKRKQVGIRVPDHQVILEVVRKLGHPVISTTCQLPGDDQPMADLFEIKDALGHVLDFAIDGDYLFPEISTVVCVEDDSVAVLREGKGSLQPFLPYLQDQEESLSGAN